MTTYPINQVIESEGTWDFSGWYHRWFTCCNGNIGVVPVGTWETGLGFTAGAQVYDKDTFGEKERTTIQATWAARTARVRRPRSTPDGASARSSSVPRGTSSGCRTIRSTGSVTTAAPSSMPAQPINAFNDPTAVHTYFRYQETRAGANGSYLLSDQFSLAGRAEYGELKYTPSTSSPMIEEVYDPNTLVGFNRTTKHVYGELELRWDSRRTADPFEPDWIRSLGSLAAISGGYVHQFDNLSAFWHYRADFQHFFRLGQGPRVLVARLHGEGVTGSIDEVPITELPYLGGGTFLRGSVCALSRPARRGRHAAVHVGDHAVRVGVPVHGRRARVSRLE